jgi:hypothetical protein
MAFSGIDVPFQLIQTAVTSYSVLFVSICFRSGRLLACLRESERQSSIRLPKI